MFSFIHSLFYIHFSLGDIISSEGISIPSEESNIKSQIIKLSIFDLQNIKSFLSFLFVEIFRKYWKDYNNVPWNIFTIFFGQPPSVWSSWWFFCLCKETSPYCRPTELSSSRQLHPLSTHSHLNRLVMDGEYSYFSYCNEVATSIFTLLHKRSSSL